jgi:hypothetical protein
MAVVFNVLLDILLFGSLVFFGYSLIELIRDPIQSVLEKTMLSMALLAGAIVALGGQVSGVGFASFTVESLTGVRPGGAAVKTIAVIIPGGLAAGLGWYFLRVSQQSAAKGLRIMTFLAMLTIVAFIEIFAEAAKTKGVTLGAAAIPNASFVAGLIITLLVLTPTEEERARGASKFRLFGDLVRRRSPAKTSLVDSPTPLRAQAKPRPQRNLFADD